MAIDDPIHAFILKSYSTQVREGWDVLLILQSPCRFLHLWVFIASQPVFRAQRLFLGGGLPEPQNTSPRWCATSPKLSRDPELRFPRSPQLP